MLKTLSICSKSISITPSSISTSSISLKDLSSISKSLICSSYSCIFLAIVLLGFSSNISRKLWSFLFKVSISFSISDFVFCLEYRALICSSNSSLNSCLFSIKCCFIACITRVFSISSLKLAVISQAPTKACLHLKETLECFIRLLPHWHLINPPKRVVYPTLFLLLSCLCLDTLFLLASSHISTGTICKSGLSILIHCSCGLGIFFLLENPGILRYWHLFHTITPLYISFVIISLTAVKDHLAPRGEGIPF